MGSMWPEYFAEVFTPSPRRSDVGRQQPGVRLYLALEDSFLPVFFLLSLSTESLPRPDDANSCR